MSSASAPVRALRALKAPALLVATLLVATAATPQQDAPPTFREDIAVTEVEIPVEVTRDGLPVRGLMADDFEVLEDGEAQPIVGFEVVDLTLAGPGAASPPGPVSSEAEPRLAGSPEVVGTTGRGRHFLLLFDFSMVDPATGFKMLRAITGTRRMVREQLHDDDRVALGWLTGGGARILVGFGEDRGRIDLGLDLFEAILDRDRRHADELLEALEGSGRGRSGRGGAGDLVRRMGSSAALALSLTAEDVLSTPLDGRLQGDRSVGRRSDALDSMSTEALVAQITDQSSLALEPAIGLVQRQGEALANLTTLLRGIPEPKHLVYFSRGIPNDWIQDDGIGLRVLDRLGDTVDGLRASGWRVDAVDINGVPDALTSTGRDASIASAPPLTVSRFDPWQGGVGFESQSLFQLSKDTGGRLLENYNDFSQATGDLIERTAVTYLLAIQPTDLAPDGTYHPLTVRLRRPLPGATIHHRAGFDAPKPGAQRTPLERSMDRAELILGARTVTGLAAATLLYPLPPLAAGHRPRDGIGGSEVALWVDVEGTSLATNAAGSTTWLEIDAFALSSENVMSDSLSQRLQLDLSRIGPALAGGPLRFVGSLRRPEGAGRVRLLVRRPDGRSFVTSLPLPAAPPPGGERWLLPPLLLRRPDAEPVTVGRAGRARQVFGELLSLDGTRMEPDLVPVLRPGEIRGVLLPFRLAAGRSPELAVSLLTAGGEPAVGAELEWLRRDVLGGGVTRLVGALRTGVLSPGDYRLEVTLEDGGRSATRFTGFRVEAADETPEASG